MKRIASILLATSLLSACTVVPEIGSRQSAATSSTVRQQPSAPAPRAQAAAASFRAPERQCFTELGQSGVQFTPVPDRYTGEGCSMIGTIQVSLLRSDYANMSVSNIGPVTCDVGTAFAAWARFGVDRAARAILGSPLERIETMGSYSCRNVAGTSRRSAHSTGDAIDISGFVLADGRRISVQGDWSGGTREEKEFLRTVQLSACRRFNTVLGPEYNAAHRDHFHLEGVIEGSSFCR